MTPDEFRASLDDGSPPDLPPALRALWWEARGDWERAHALAQEDEADPDLAWVHAYLHRREGDAGNAAYWYRRADRLAARGDLEAEWAEIAASLLQQGPS